MIGHFICSHIIVVQVELIVVCIEEIEDGDRLTIVPKPGLLPSSKVTAYIRSVAQLLLPVLHKQVSHSRVEDILSKVKKPSEAEARALSKCFPGGKNPSTSASTEFNPRLDYKKKQKRATKLSKVEVIMLKEFQGWIPKGEARKKLRRKGRVSDVSFTMSMTNSQIEATIKKALKALKVFLFLRQMPVVIFYPILL